MGNCKLQVNTPQVQNKAHFPPTHFRRTHGYEQTLNNGYILVCIMLVFEIVPQIHDNASDIDKPLDNLQ